MPALDGLRGQVPPRPASPHAARAPLLPRRAEAPSFRYWTWGLPAFAAAWLAVFVTVTPAPLALFGQNWPLILVGVLGALIGNATAVGGGLLFVPVMLFVYQVPAVTGLKLAIASQCFGMTSGAIGWLRRGTVPLDALGVTVPALLIGSTVSTLLLRPNALLVKGLFGPVSMLLGVLVLVLAQRHGTRDDIPARARVPLFLMSVVGGLLTGWVAIGEGEIIAAFLMLAYGLRVERAVGLGVVLLSINSLYLLFLHQVVLDGVPWDLALFTGLGCVFGARLGPYLAQWIAPRTLKCMFAAIAIADGAVFLLQFLLPRLL